VSEAIRIEDGDGARRISLDRPPVNVLDLPTIRRLYDALRALPGRRDLKVVVLRSAIPGVFSAGVDVRDHGRQTAPEMLEAFHAVLRLMDGLPQALLAAVDGRCLGGGCELALACDLVLATPGSTFGQPEIDVGCFPPAAAVLLPRLAGRRAIELVLGGAPIPAAEAERCGLISRVVEDLAAETQTWVARLSAKSGAVLALARRAVRSGGQGTFDEALGRVEALYRDELLATEDAEEGVRAFLEKRPPRWRDR
jgi:cyclohexa-1,5-dienecarbonyl-CoA hydratase